jgi:fermentation-respiration switch protein FrsA (DUF1100 family)
MMVTQILLIFVAIYVLIVLYMYVFQRNYAFQPDPNSAFDADHKPFVIFNYTSPEGLKLRGLIAPAQQNKLTIVHFHGNAGNLAHRLFKAAYYLPKGYGLVLVGYRGYGGNPGVPSEKGFYEDARASIEYLKQQGIPTKNMIFYGESMGTGVAVQMATEYPDAKAIVLEAPFTSAVDVGAAFYPYLPVRYLMRDRFDSASKIDKVTMPVLVIHGTKDETVAYRFGKTLFEHIKSVKKEFITIEGGNHMNLYDFKAGEIINAFLEKL